MLLIHILYLSLKKRLFQQQMSTRAASAAKSLRAREALVKVLFGGGGQQNSKNTSGCLRPQVVVDHSAFTHQQLRTEYLKRVQELHPDKHRSKDPASLNQNGGSIVLDEHDAKQKFVELKEAWNQYEVMAKTMKVSKGQETAANFTMFGVGCSFSDNEEERSLRNEIMDQASRGWFSAGALVDAVEKKKDVKSTANGSGGPQHEALCDDNLFTQEEDKKESSNSVRPIQAAGNKTRPSLVSHLIRPPRR